MRFCTMILVTLVLPLAVAFCPRAVAEETADVQSPSNDEDTAAAAPRFAKRAVPIEGTFGEGWRQTVELPPSTFVDASGHMTLSVEQGWLCVRRESSAGQLEWQIVLCKVEKGVLPEIEVMEDMPLFVDISYRDDRYFVREAGGVLRAMREVASGGTLLAKDAILSPDTIARGFGGSPPWVGITCTSWEDDGWYFIASGPAGDRESWRAVVRLNPMDMPGGYGVTTGVTGVIRYFHGDTWLIDDGELLVAERMSLAAYEAQKKQEAAREAILAGEPPAIDATEWLNTDAAPTWNTLKGKVVLVDFWGTWCGPCVAKLPDTQKLYEKYADRGLVVIGIHSEQDADTCAAFLEENGYTFPVALDSGKTAEAFAISGWPTYFLIDRSGKVVEGFTSNVPSEEKVEALLSGSEK